MQGLSPGLNISDRFNLVRRLGVGGMGEVWLAHDSELDDSVALKILDPKFSSSPQFVDLLRQECSRARSLVHPNIVLLQVREDLPIALLAAAKLPHSVEFQQDYDCKSDG